MPPLGNLAPELAARAGSASSGLVVLEPLGTPAQLSTAGCSPSLPDQLPFFRVLPGSGCALVVVGDHWLWGLRACTPAPLSPTGVHRCGCPLVLTGVLVPLARQLVLLLMSLGRYALGCSVQNMSVLAWAGHAQLPSFTHGLSTITCLSLLKASCPPADLSAKTPAVGTRQWKTLVS